MRKTIQTLVMSSSISIVNLIFLSGCVHSLPFRDLHPDEAKKEGYFLNSEEAIRRGGIAGYVPQNCSNGGWGFPSKDCAGVTTAAVSEPAAAPVTASRLDSDGDGVFDENDQCKETPRGTKVNALGCPLGQRTEIRLNVQFLTGSAKLAPGSSSQVDRVAQVLSGDSGLKIKIEGHTDNTGDAQKNQILSEQRAKSVLDYLVLRGVLKEQLSSKGFGSSQPIANNSTAAGRKLNRRVTAILE